LTTQNPIKSPYVGWFIRYFRRPLSLKNFGVDSVAEVLDLIKDTASWLRDGWSKLVISWLFV
jgi:hypothetical protein